MTDVAPNADPGSERRELTPVPEAERIRSLDVLRGFALLGILVMNIQSFAMIGAAYMNPTAFMWGDRWDAGGWVWLLSHVFADQKFMTLFSILFGAGITLMADRAAKTGRRFLRPYHRRTLWLLVFGTLHAYLFWYGDILFGYAICGLVVVHLRNARPRTLILTGLGALAIGSLIFQGAGMSMPYWPEESVAALRADWMPDAEAIAAEIAAYQGGIVSQIRHRAPDAAAMQFFLVPVWVFWRAGGLMLVGMAFYRLGVLQGSRNRQFYLGWIAAAIGLGIPLILLGVERNFAAGWSIERMFAGAWYNYWGSLLVAMGWLSSVVLLVRSGAIPWLQNRLAAVGRMALTNYLLHTLICTTLFYGHGLGWFGTVGRPGQIAVVLGVWAAQLAISPIWLRSFRYGPFEWVWRALTYRSRPGFRRA